MGWTVRGAMVLAIVVVAAVVVSPGGAAFASGGGGCGRPVTDARGDIVRIRDYCFGPTILRARPGDEISFVNQDGFSHTVMGANASWGSYRELRAEARVTYRFTRPGVYPYVCTWHPGMIGAVVVGGGPRMSAVATTTADGPVVRVEPQPRIAPVVASDPAVVRSQPLPPPDGRAASLQPIALALLALLAVGWAARVRRGIRSMRV